MADNVNESVLIHENRSRLLALETEIVGNRKENKEFYRLLALIDQRQEQMVEDVNEIKDRLISNAEHQRLIETVTIHESRIYKLEMEAAKTLAYYTGVSATIFIVFSLVKDVVFNFLG